jgi:uncharacterized protein DUF5677
LSVQIALRHRKYFRVFRRALDLALSLLLEAEVPASSQQKVVAAALLGRLIESAQSGVELSRRGLERDAAAMVRICFDHYLMLRGCCSDRAFVEEYLKAELVRQLKLIRGAMQLSNLLPAQHESYRAREQELAGEVQRIGARELKAEQLAGRFQMADEYNTVFRLSSPFVHPSIRALEESVQSEEGQLVGLLFGPSDRYTEMHVFTLAEYLLRGAGELGNLLEVTWCLRNWNRIYADLRELQPRWPDDE